MLCERSERKRGFSSPRYDAPRAAVSSQHRKFSGGDQNANQLSGFHCPKGISSGTEARLWLEQVEKRSLWEAIQKRGAPQRKVASTYSWCSRRIGTWAQANKMDIFPWSGGELGRLWFSPLLGCEAMFIPAHWMQRSGLR